MGVMDVLSGEKMREILEKVAEWVWYEYLKPMAAAYVKQTDNTWDDAAYDKVCELVEQMLNKISATDGD